MGEDPDEGDIGEEAFKVDDFITGRGVSADAGGVESVAEGVEVSLGGAGVLGGSGGHGSLPLEVRN